MYIIKHTQNHNLNQDEIKTKLRLFNFFTLSLLTIQKNVFFQHPSRLSCAAPHVGKHCAKFMYDQADGACILERGTVVVCVQLCQTASVQVQKESFCKVVWISVPGMLPDPDVAVMKSRMFTCFLCLLSPPQINNILVCLVGLGFWSHKAIKAPGPILLIIWRLPAPLPVKHQLGL